MVTNKLSEQVRWVVHMLPVSNLGAGAMSVTQRLLVLLRRASISQRTVAHTGDCEFKNCLNK